MDADLPDDDLISQFFRITTEDDLVAEEPDCHRFVGGTVESEIPPDVLEELEQHRRDLIADESDDWPEDDTLDYRVLKLANLEAGWHDGDGGAYDSVELAAVAGLLNRLAGVANANVYPVPNGNVGVEWRGGDRRNSLEIDPRTLSTQVHLFDAGAGAAMTGEIATDSGASEAKFGPGITWLLEQVEAASTKAGDDCNYLALVDAEDSRVLINLKHKKVDLAIREFRGTEWK